MATLIALKNKLDALAIDQLRAEVVSLYELLERTERELWIAYDQIDFLEMERDCLRDEMDQNHTLGLTKDGQCVAVPKHPTCPEA